jgi:transposase InsO family protein
MHGCAGDLSETRTTVPGDPSERFPCLGDLWGITAVDQVWTNDITYVLLQKGFLYVVDIVDLFSRNVLGWKLSKALPQSFVLMPARSHWKLATNQRSSTPIRDVNSPQLTSWLG